MKILLTTLTLALCGPSALAGTAVSYSNDSLNFTLTFSAMSDETSICDASDNCLTLFPVKSLSKTKTLYREKEGKCDLVIEQFDKNFAEGTTKNEFMLSLGGQVVKVIKGEDRCQLHQDLMNQKRSVTGIYL